MLSPRPCSAELTRARLIDLAEVFPDGLEVRRPNADAGVDDVDADAIRPLDALRR